MATTVDGFDIFRRIAANPELFADVKSLVGKAARDIVVKHLKAKSTDLKVLRGTLKSLGTDNYSLILDAMKDAEIKVLAAKLDKHHPDVKTADTTWRRRHLAALAAGDVEPAAKPAGRAKKAAAPKAPKEAPSRGGPLLQSEAMAAVRNRKR